MVHVTIDGRRVQISPQTFSMRDLAQHLGLDQKTRAIKIKAIEFRGRRLALPDEVPESTIGGNDSYQVMGGEDLVSIGID